MIEPMSENYLASPEGERDHMSNWESVIGKQGKYPAIQVMTAGTEQIISDLLKLAQDSFASD